MLERLAGNDALKRELGTALHSGRLPHAVLLVGEPGCGAGFAARCLAADYLYPAGGPHAEAVLKGEDTECLALRGEGASGQIPVKRVREAREAIQRSALSTDAAGRVLFIYGAQNLNGTQGSSANALLKIIEEPPEGGAVFVDGTQRSGGAADHSQPVCGLYDRAGAGGGLCRPPARRTAACRCGRGAGLSV